MPIFAWDARGHGRSATATPPPAPATIGRLIKDVDDFVKHLAAEHGVAVEDLAVLGQSVGAVLAAAWVHDFAPPIRSMVLAAPAFSVRLYVPFARAGLGLLHSTIGHFRVNSYVKPTALTHDPERIASYRADPLIRRPIDVNILLALYSTAVRAVEDAQAITVPTQLLISGSDFVVHRKPQDRFFERLGSAVKERHVFDGFYHDTLGEHGRAPAIAKVRAFLERQFAEAPARATLVDADRTGYTHTEFDALSTPLPAFSPKAINFGLTRFSMRTGGRLSDGIRLGVDSGFDSGSSLDYVYRNRPSGITPIGTLIDWFYLNSPGWTGIRVRKQLIQELIALAMNAGAASGRPVRIVDVAAGHGRYVSEAIRLAGVKPDHVLLRDIDQQNVELGRRLIAEQGLRDEFQQGDAFDLASLAALQPKPTIGIVSGLFELFPENHRVRATLEGLAGAIEPGGCLVYTGQPWHPQIEFIARTLTSHREGAAVGDAPPHPRGTG